MLANIYWKRKKKKLRMLPMYADKTHRSITFGEIFEYNPDAPLKQEQERIVAETLRQIRGIENQNAENARKEKEK